MDNDLIEDRLAIEQLIKTSAVGAMRKDPVLWSNTWSEDGCWTIDSLDEPVRGKANVVALFEKLIAGIEFVSMTSFLSNLTIDGDTGRGQVYSQELIFPKAGGRKILVGCFHDEYVKRDERWYFLTRRFETLRRGPLIDS